MEITPEIYDICLKHALKFTKGNLENAEDVVQRTFFYILNANAEIRYMAGYTKSVENAFYTEYLRRYNQIIRFNDVGQEYEDFITVSPEPEQDYTFLHKIIDESLTDKQKEVVKFYMNNSTLLGHSDNYNSFKSNFRLAKNKLKKILLDKYPDLC